MTAEVAKSSRRTQPRDKVPSRGSKPGERRGGREKGTPNKVTKDIREAITQLLETCAPRMADWLERVAKDDPAKALDLALKAAEYAIPKLSRAEVNTRARLSLEDLIAGSDGEHGEPLPQLQQTYANQPVAEAERVPAMGAVTTAPTSASPPEHVPAAEPGAVTVTIRRSIPPPPPRAASSYGGNGSEPYNPL
jgi:hypothetical protein